MKYAHSLTVAGIQNDTGMYTSPVWNNFVQYTKTKRIVSGNLHEAHLIVKRELTAWNACNDEGCDTISFKSEADRTMFLLRFS